MRGSSSKRWQIYDLRSLMFAGIDTGGSTTEAVGNESSARVSC